MGGSSRGRPLLAPWGKAQLNQLFGACSLLLPLFSNRALLQRIPTVNNALLGLRSPALEIVYCWAQLPIGS